MVVRDIASGVKEGSALPCSAPVAEAVQMSMLVTKEELGSGGGDELLVSAKLAHSSGSFFLLLLFLAWIRPPPHSRISLFQPSSGLGGGDPSWSVLFIWVFSGDRRLSKRPCTSSISSHVFLFCWPPSLDSSSDVASSSS